MKNNRSIKLENCDYKKIRSIIEKENSRVHFVGIGGVSMYSLARLVMNMGVSVSGSDREASSRTEMLSTLGAKIYIGHSEDNIGSADLVVYSHAISDDNAELLAAGKTSVPTVSRALLLGALMLDYRCRIGVSGSHGKSTTVAMLDAIFSRAGCEPTTLCGADLPFGDPMRVGEKSLLIYEACEYRDSFLRFCPTISLGLNLEMDHPDYFTSLDHLKTSFAKALGRATNLALISGDDQNLRDISKRIGQRALTFGFGQENDYRYSITSYKRGGSCLSLSRYGVNVGEFEINLPGSHNLHNAAAAITVALEYGIDVETVADAISDFRGIPRRLEYLGEYSGREIYYDYAHHPTEIASAINALKSITYGRLCVVFKPHTYSRTAALWSEFCSALSLADEVIITEIYPAREDPIPGITAERLASDIKGAIFLPDNAVREKIRHIDARAVVLMGAGDMEEIKNSLI